MTEIGSILAVISRGGQLGDFEKCPICKQFGWTGAHHCGPAFEVRPDYYDAEDVSTVYADDAEEAAKRFLEEQFWNFECPTEMTVVVTRDDEEWTFHIDVEMVPSFHAEEVSRKKIEQEEVSEDE